MNSRLTILTGTLPGHRAEVSLRRWVVAASAAALLAASPCVHASTWKRLVKTESLSVYVDMSTLERDDDVRRIWEMQDLVNPDANGTRSRRYVNEFNCTHKVHRIGNMTTFAGPKLTGRILSEVEEMGYWRKIPPDGTFAVTYVLLCVE